MSDRKDRKGRTLAISLPRRWIGDLLHFAHKVPAVVVQRQMNLAALQDARERSAQRIRWCAIFTRAYAKVASEFPELRRAWLGFPWAHFYEHPFSIASVAIERLYEGERAVFFVHLRFPEYQSLVALDAHLHRFQSEPIDTVGLYRRALAVSRLPWPLRRLLWWVGLNVSGPKRAARMGTFGVSVYSGLGAESFNHHTVLTTSLNYGVIASDGSVAVRVIYDHRVMDGGTVARVLARLEEVLNTDLVAELDGLSSRSETGHPVANTFAVPFTPV
jgi:hypothetical protein